MLKKLTTKKTHVLDEESMKKINGEGPFSCMVHTIEILTDCSGHEGLMSTLYDDTRAGLGGWL